MRISDDLTWLLQWFADQCDEDWEHEYSIYKEIALNKIYEKIPDKIPYRFFQFLDLDEERLLKL